MVDPVVDGEPVGSTSTQSAVASRSDSSDSELFGSVKWTEALKEGERVEVSGLLSAAHHNGKCGVLGPFLQAENRWVVHLDSGGCPLKVRQENLTGKLQQQKPVPRGGISKRIQEIQI